MQKEKLNKRKVYTKQEVPSSSFQMGQQTDGIVFLGLIQGPQQLELTPGPWTPFPLMQLKLLE